LAEISRSKGKPLKLHRKLRKTKETLENNKNFIKRMETVILEEIAQNKGKP